MINVKLSKPSRSDNISRRLHHLFMSIVCVTSLCFVSTLCLQSSFSFTNVPFLLFATPSISINGSLNNSNNNNNNQTIFGGLMHNMSDGELLLRASRVVKIMPRVVQDVPYCNSRVAFMFLTPGPLPLAPFWEMFFKGYEGMYSVYVHPHPSYDDFHVPRDSAFYGRRIPSQVCLLTTSSFNDIYLIIASISSSRQPFLRPVYKKHAPHLSTITENTSRNFAYYYEFVCYGEKP
ncbi:PREDICTED: uncharacterized protein LOC105975304 [Erythranthe guttata]|uniref:uncharacterized protein LOC105975304 n=1 Tax=Erythranthe guttata TaxID=4155 RepID=UPI00064D9AE7|nr:PREDICTED: uncharacterized protein LOC105975304 [Erythranthe guttata]|eukprot:XP_012855940.1 PREDICTED: uncharacterized protein LOC105975304 [Erythranthe guttata]